MLNIAQLGLMQSFSGGFTHELTPELTAWLAKGTALGYILPSITIQNALNDFILDLGTDLRNRMKTGYIMHAGSKEMGSLNLKDPNTYQTSLVNSPTFSEGNGMKSGGTSYINQPFKSNEYAGIQNDLTAIQYVSESSTAFGTITPHGMRISTTGAFYFYRSLRTSSVGDYSNSVVTLATMASTNHKGLYVHNNNGTNSVIYKDGTKTSTVAAPTAPNVSVNRLILAVNDATTGVVPIQFYTKYVAVDFLFDLFTDADELAFRTAFNTYKTAVGLP